MTNPWRNIPLAICLAAAIKHDKDIQAGNTAKIDALVRD